MLQFPVTRPDEDASGPALWAVQLRLMRIAEAFLGPRDSQRKLYQPAFHPNGPHIRNTVNEDGAFAELSMNAAGYWPTVVFELAHETVHLLDPIAGSTTWIEEGVAVEFSELMSEALTSHPMSSSSGTAYEAARNLLRHLPGPPLASAGHLRHRYGPLSTITAYQITTTFPQVSAEIALQLTSNCKPR